MSSVVTQNSEWMEAHHLIRRISVTPTSWNACCKYCVPRKWNLAVTSKTWIYWDITWYTWHDWCYLMDNLWQLWPVCTTTRIVYHRKSPGSDSVPWSIGFEHNALFTVSSTGFVPWRARAFTSSSAMGLFMEFTNHAHVFMDSFLTMNRKV